MLVEGRCCAPGHLTAGASASGKEGRLRGGRNGLEPRPWMKQAGRGFWDDRLSLENLKVESVRYRDVFHAGGSGSLLAHMR